MRRIAVIGGGITGLAAALRARDLAEQHGTPADITIFEPASLGGCISTEHANGLVMEAGPDSLLVDKPWGMRLLERLGLKDELVGMQPEYRGARIVHRGKLRKLPPEFRLFSPTSLPALLRSGLFSARGIARAAVEPLVPRRAGNADESLASFVRRRFGSEVLDRLAQPLVGGIYSGDPERLSMEATLPQFLELERRYGSLVRAMSTGKASAAPPKLMSLRGGLGTLIAALDRELAGVTRVARRIENLQEIRTEFNGFICATPAYAAAEILRHDAPELAALLQQIRYNSIATISLAYDRAAIPELPRMQGFIVPFVERRSIVAATIVSQKYPGRAPADTVLLRAFAGGALQPGLVNRSDAELVSLARAEFADLLNVRAEPRLARVWKMVRLLPEYGIGHVQLVDEIERKAAAIPGLALAGSAYRGVGIPDCIHSGEVAAERALGMM